MRSTSLKAAAAAAVVAAGLSAVTRAGDVTVSVTVGAPPPAPVVVEYDTYCVGYRAALYDADWRLRVAQQDQWRAQDELIAARRSAGELALVVEDQETLVAKYGKQTAESDAAVAAARARLDAFEKRVASAKSDRDAARTLNDSAGVAEAETRIKNNESAAMRAADDLHAAEEDAAKFRTVRAQLDVAQTDLPARRAELVAARDQVYAAQQHLDHANMAVAVALHDRDEALWMLHREEIMTGRCEFTTCGFVVERSRWGPRADVEVVHTYYVHPAAYWVEHPVEVNTRVIEVERVTEVTRVREIQVRREPRAAEIVVFERSVPAERRRERAEVLVVERQRFEAERSERAAAVAEHRAPRVSEAERAEARAVAVKARADAKSERIEDRADARAENIKARADAKSEVTAARADAKSEVTAARADARSEEIKARADAKSEKTEARADAQAEKTEARADAKAEKTEARADAKAEKTEARAEAKAEKDEAKSDAKSKTEEAKADGKAEPKPGSSSRSGTASNGRYGSDPRGGPNSRGTSANSNNNGRNSKNKKDSTASNDYNNR